MNIVEKFINIIGEYISYLIPLMTLLMIIVIVSRYFFGIGQTGLQELVMYFHALVFLGCAGYAFNKDEHVRVDIFYRDASDKYKNVINTTLETAIPNIITVDMLSLPLFDSVKHGNNVVVVGILKIIIHVFLLYFLIYCQTFF